MLLSALLLLFHILKKCPHAIKKLNCIIPCTLQFNIHGSLSQLHVLDEIENTLGDAVGFRI